jgi:hypothetical protein
VGVGGGGLPEGRMKNSYLNKSCICLKRPQRPVEALNAGFFFYENCLYEVY